MLWAGEGSIVGCCLVKEKEVNVNKAGKQKSSE